MQMQITVETGAAKRLATKFPRAAGIALNNFKERVGFTLEGQAKEHAPAITGNLRRSIFFEKDSPMGARVIAYANYAPYVHGAPFYTNQLKRKETPFFTYALLTSASAIGQYKRGIMKDIVANIGN